MEEKCNFPAIAVPMVEIAESGIKCSRFNGQESGRTYASNTGKSSVSYTEFRPICMQSSIVVCYNIIKLTYLWKARFTIYSM